MEFDDDDVILGQSGIDHKDAHREKHNKRENWTFRRKVKKGWEISGVANNLIEQ